MGRSHTVGQCPGQGWTLSRRGSCQGRSLAAGPVPLWPPVLFSPLTGSDGYNPFLTTGEILGFGLDSDPARAWVRHSVIGRGTCFSQLSGIGIPLAWLGPPDCGQGPQTDCKDSPNVTGGFSLDRVC